MPPTFLGRTDPARMLTNILQRLERLERRQKGGSSTRSSGTAVSAGDYVQLVSSDYTAGAATATSPSLSSQFNNWVVLAGNAALVDITDVDGTVTLTQSGQLVAVTGTLSLKSTSSSGALGGAGFFPNTSITPVCGQTGGVYDADASLPGDFALDIYTPISFTGPLDHMEVTVSYDDDATLQAAAQLIIVNLATTAA